MFLDENEVKSIGFKSIGSNVKISSYSRFYNPSKISIGNNSRIDDYCVISDNVVIGNNVHITVNCSIAAPIATVTIADFVGIAAGSRIFSSSDDYSGLSLTNATIPKKFTNVKHAEVIISKHVIIGAGSTVFPGVEIMEGCAIGAMSLVNKSTEPWGVYVGIPAKKLKARSKNLMKLEDLYLNEISKDKNLNQ
jgi:galactoside O-acetyltransferase/dTDP-4-amino-4,6-dideoxygalactose transaminase